MAGDHIQITRISAEDLKDVAFISKMASYAVVYHLSDPQVTRHQTPIDREGHTRPTWTCLLRIPVQPSGTTGDAVLRILIRSKGLLGLGNRDIGSAEIVVGNLKRPSGEFRCDVLRPSGRIQGRVAVSYEFVRDDRPEGGSGTSQLLRASLEAALVGGVVGGLVALSLSGGGGSSLQTGARSTLEQLLRVCEEVSPFAGRFAGIIRAVVGELPRV